MAKLNGPLGSKLRGKVGEVVAAKTVGGVTAIRSYQPVVKNPNTRRQQAARQKFADISALAAAMAYGIQIGYAKAVSGMNMYARNLFMKVCASTLNLYDEGDFTWGALKVSKKSGLEFMPMLPTVAYATATGLTCRVGTGTPTRADNGNDLGVIFVLYEKGFHDCRVLTGKVSTAASDGLVLAPGKFVAGGEYQVYAFLKEILPTGTEIPTDTYPWKYPSNTGDTIYVGTVVAQA